MSKLFDIAHSFLVNDEWNPTVDESETGSTRFLRTAFSGTSGRWRCLMVINEEREQVCMYSILDVNCPGDQRGAVSEFITRANYGLIIGNFELDYSDGEIRYKSSVDVEGGELTDLMVKNLCYANVLTVDRYFPGLMAVMYGGKDPEGAVHEVENPN